ncbi:MAG: response regulator [Candidatus Omnitrophica bacterium]|nr:response regulator [Candidatus Omnitrophota bacterium]
MGPKILTVDDSKTIRAIVARAFKPFLCEVLEAEDGLEGLVVANREKPDVILLDCMMPVMDGMEMLAKMKSNPEHRNIPVVMLTAESTPERVVKLARLGVRDYLIKPFREEALVDRVGRIVELKKKREPASKAKRFDDPIHLLLVDNKPAILDQLQTGLSDTRWSIKGVSQPGEAVDYCSRKLPEVVMISLSLPENAGFMLFEMLRASVKTKTIPILALSVKTAADEQSRAQQAGFTGIVTKPIDMDELKAKITRALGLDTSYRYFQCEKDLLLVRFPPVVTQPIANDISINLRPRICEAVDAGLCKLIMDLSQLKAADVVLIELAISIVQLCREMEIRYSLIGSEPVRRECRNLQETKDWEFAVDYDEALASLDETEKAQA